VRFVAGIWNLYLGLLAVLGHTLLILIGLGLCAYATMLQMRPLHDVLADVLLFAGGLLLVSVSMIRRMVWALCGLGVVWCGLVWAVLTLFTDAHRGIDITPELIAIAVIPPFFGMLYLETLHKRTSDLEISLSEKNDSES
jgi:hypothetical protein